MPTAVVLTLPLLLITGLLTRSAAHSLVLMTLVIQFFAYPNTFDGRDGEKLSSTLYGIISKMKPYNGLSASIRFASMSPDIEDLLGSLVEGARGAAPVRSTSPRFSGREEPGRAVH